jgi:hypothetical protein
MKMKIKIKIKIESHFPRKPIKKEIKKPFKLIFLKEKKKNT